MNPRREKIKMQYQKQSLFFSESEDEGAKSNKVSEMRECLKGSKRKVYFDAEQGPRVKRGQPFKMQKSFQESATRPCEVEEQPSKMIVTLATFHKIYMQSTVDIDNLTISPSQSPFIKWAFSQVIQNLRYRKTSQQTAQNTAKIRTNLIKKITEEYVHLYISSTRSGHRTLDRRPLRIQAPSVVSNQYLTKLFSYSPFQQFFQQYVCENRVREFYLEKCYKDVMQFCDGLEMLATARTGDDRKCEQFRRMEKPMSFIEVRQYEVQASMMLETYSL